MGYLRACVVVLLSVGCGSVKSNADADAGAPAITSFTANPTSVQAGSMTMLTAVFEGGDGFINNGGGPVASGVPIAMSPTATTTFVLTVSRDRAMVTKDVTVVVLDFAVTSLADAGPNTLRAAIIATAATASPKTIGIVTAGTISLATELPPVTGNVTIAGAAGGPVTIDGGGKMRVVMLDGTVIVRDLVLANGRATGGAGSVDQSSGGGGGGAGGLGGGMYVNSGTVTLDHVMFTGNAAIGGKGGAAGSFNLGTGGGGGGGFAGGGGGGGNANGAPGGAGGTGGIGGGGGGGGGGNVAGARGVAGMFGGAGGSNGSAGGGGGGGGLGGALFVRSGATTLRSCTFTNNAATGGTGGIPFGIQTAAGGNGLGKGGAIFVNGNATVTSSNAAFSGNTASDAGTIGTDSNDVFGVVN